MKRYCALGCVFFLAANADYAQTATEKAEKRLADLLAPGSGATPFASKPVAWRGTASVETIVLALKPIAGVPVRLPLPPIKEIKPRPAPEGQPLIAFRVQPKGPKDVELPTQPLIKLPSLDVHAPLPIPILAQPFKDRASLGDPAFDASLEASLKRITPTRDRPVPFAAQNLPDPFENLPYGQLRNPPEEHAMPPAVPLIKPMAK